METPPELLLIFKDNSTKLKAIRVEKNRANLLRLKSQKVTLNSNPNTQINKCHNHMSSCQPINKK